MKRTIIKNSLTLLLVLTGGTVFAQEQAVATVSAFGSWLDWTVENIVLLIGAATVVGAVWAIVNLNNQLMELNRIRVLQEHGIEMAEKLNVAKGESSSSRWYSNLTQAVPIEKEADVMLEHNYDGIRELDNILPPWWVGMFYATIIFGVAYIGYYHFSDYGVDQATEYEMEVTQFQAAVKAYLAKQTDLVDENTVTVVADENALAMGGTIYINNCAVCHGPEGQGGVGPNLTDAHWIHGGDVKDLFKTIKYGVPEKGMISWKAQLKAGDMQKVASYILTLQGTNPPNPKAPEGVLYTPKTDAPADGDAAPADEESGTIGMNQE